MRLKLWLSNFIVKNTLKGLTKSDIITQDQYGIVYIGGEKITDEEAKSLVEEVKFLKSTRIWQIMQETCREQAHQTLFTKVKTTDDIFWGKALLYNLDLQDKILKIFEK